MYTLELRGMKNILIFDFDGVLADSLMPMLAYARQVCQELGHPCEPTQADLEALERMEFSEFGRQLDLPEDMIDTFVRRNFELFYNQEEPLAIIPNMEQVIRALSGQMILAIVTGNSSKVVRKFIENYGLNDLFAIILSAEDEGNRVDKINKAKESFTSPIGEVYMVGDAVSDIRAARRAGVKSIAITWGHQSQEKLSAEAPDFMLEEPGDLLSLFGAGQC